MDRNKLPLNLEKMTENELHELFESDEEVLVPPSDLESICSNNDSDKEDADEMEIFSLDNENNFDFVDEVDNEKNVILEWDSDDDIPLSEVRRNIIGGKIPTWTKVDKPDRPYDFDEKTAGVPDFIKAMNDCTPFKVFQLFLSDELLDDIVYQTNLYAHQKHLVSGKKFISTDLHEIKVFLGINILMGIKRLPSYRDYWSSDTDLHDYFISNLMPVNRFGWLLTNLHLNNNADMPKRIDPSFDKLYKLRPFLSSLQESFRRCLNLHEHVAVDESMIRFKGRSSLKQYMPKKPIKRGFKVWILADQTGYAWAFDIYTGKSIEGVKKNLGSVVVKSLCKDIIGKGHKVIFDNYFTSIDLLTWLKENGLNGCGTINSNRKNLPVFKPDKTFKKGDIESYGSFCGLAAWKWKDNRCIHLVSNYHDPNEVTFVNRKDKRGTITEVPCPTVLKEYNTFMNCVDKFDQLKSVYDINRKSKKWWHRVFFYFIDASITNSFIIYKLLGNENLSMKKFRREIVQELVAKKAVNLTKKRLSRDFTQSIKLGKKKPSTSAAIRHTESAHQPVRDTRRRCANCSTSKQEARTDWICSVCNVPLCLSKRKNCFQAYHYVKEINYCFLTVFIFFYFRASNVAPA